MNKQEIEKKLNDSGEFLSLFKGYLDDNFKIPGGEHLHSVRDWEIKFWIKMPPDINFQTLVSLSAEVVEKYQKASTYRDMQSCQLSVLESVKSEDYYNAYQSARLKNEQEFGKPLAAESCKVAALLAVKELEDAMASQKIFRDFWDKICNRLVEMRKNIELMIRALGADAYLQRDIVIKS